MRPVVEGWSAQGLSDVEEGARPWAEATVAKVCRRPWRVILGRPFLLINRVKPGRPRWGEGGGRSGPPPPCRESSYRSPSARRFSACLARSRLRRRTSSSVRWRMRLEERFWSPSV